MTEIALRRESETTPTPSNTAAMSRPNPTTGLTMFPKVFEDEPDPGMLPTFISRVKNTFVSSASVSSSASATGSRNSDKGPNASNSVHHGRSNSVNLSGEGSTQAPGPLNGGSGTSSAQTEAQALAEAVRQQTLRQSSAARRSKLSASSGIEVTPSSPDADSPNSLNAAQGKLGGLRSDHTDGGLRPPLQAVHSASSSISGAPSGSSSRSGSRSMLPPSDKHWRPMGMIPASVTISPLTSVTTAVQASGVPVFSKPTEDETMGSSSSQYSRSRTNSISGPSRPPASSKTHGELTGLVARRATGQHITHSSQSFPQASGGRPVNALGSAGVRLRRSSIATLPDSPSSISLSAMIAANAELSQNSTHIPGFSIADDTRSVRSLGMNKASNGVSKLIRRMRGEGLSKHYWMADEHCKECYDCKSVFTAWRRKHHCRICGQIFCSRCASNIIGARRFGQEGAVRVCNLCLQIMEEYKDDEEDDRRSINSATTGYQPGSISDKAFLDAAISPEGRPYQRSPFAASQLFASNPNESLSAIDETATAHPWGPNTLSRPLTPIGQVSSPLAELEELEQMWASRPQTAAPFRRPMEYEGVDNRRSSETSDDPDTTPPKGSRIDLAVSGRNSPTVDGLSGPPSRDERSDGPHPFPPRVGFPRTDTISTDGGMDGRVPLSQIDPNQPLIGLRTRLSSRTSQGGLTALLDSEMKEGLWRARSHSFAQRPELLSGASLRHFMLMLEQAIHRAGLPNPQEWLETLSSLLLKVATNLHPDVRAGDSIDVRAHVKVKKVPGGKISDSEYVDGIVITKNVAHKAMARRLVNPRIMIVTFPLDYHRVENQFMSLEPILAQERDYLRLLTRRIIDVRPHIVLVERSVSRIALEFLLEANIALARSVKPSALHQVARCTQADVVASMDRLAVEPRLGRCAEFQIQSFEHDFIPGRRKTLMRFEGCHRDLGCTIILRGGDLPTLRKVKVVTDFMALVAYHLKNEIIMFSDEHNIFPPQPPLPEYYEELLDKLNDTDMKIKEQSDARSGQYKEDGIHGEEEEHHDVDKAREKLESLRLTRDIAKSLEPYLTTVLSASAAVRFPPPAPLGKMAELDRLLTKLETDRDEQEAAQILQDEQKGVELPKSSINEEATSAQAVPIIKEPNDGVVEVASSTAMSIVGTTALASKDGTRDPYRVLRKPLEVARESVLAQIKHDHTEHLKLWRWYHRRNIPTLRPEDFQGILYLYSLGCEGSEKPCVEPVLQATNFYQPDDLTVGQFLEGIAADAIKRCPSKTCDRLLLFHFRLLVHGNRRLQIAMDQFPCPSPGHEDQIITWSYCRTCSSPSPTTILRDETWKMSWGSYLEHCFYPPETSAGFDCPHDAYRDQIRYFAHRNLAIRIHNEQIEVFDPIRPSISLQTRAESKVQLKNMEYESALMKNAAFFDSVLFRLRSFDYEIVQPEKVSLMKTTLENMLARAVADREEMVNLLNQTYKLTPVTDVLALNVVLRALLDKVVHWDSEFAEIEKVFLPSEKDLRRMTAAHLKRLFASQEAMSGMDRNTGVAPVSEVDEKEVKTIDGISEEGDQNRAGMGEDEADGEQERTVESTGDASEETSTPVAGLYGPQAEFFSPPPMTATPPPQPRGYDSDSTISAIKKESPSAGASRIQEDRNGLPQRFVSRIPRRPLPSPSVANMVKRFQETSSGPFTEDEIAHQETETRRSASRKSRKLLPSLTGSDSEVALRVPTVRPKMRRGRTEQVVSRRSQGLKAGGAYSDNDRSYAANASRLPSARYRLEADFSGLPTPRPRKEQADATMAISGRASPIPDRLLAPVPRRQPSGIAADPKAREASKARATRPNDPPLSGRTSPLPPTSRTATRRAIANSNRVTSIARHFDRLSREAERERQKRISMVRGKRARPVSLTKATVQVFNNVRDAFKDESDSDSSEADNEEDDQAGDESAGSGGEEFSRKSSSPSRSLHPPGSRRRRRSSTKRESSMKPLTEVDSSSLATPIPSGETGSTSSGISGEVIPSAPTPIPVSASGSSASVPLSLFGDSRSEMSYKDRLQIELPSFETSAPLPSVPVTPQLSTDTADENRPGRAASMMSQVSEGELSSGGGERSSILKTLTGLWAFRAGDYSPLEYPLSAAEHVFADSKVIIRENEPTSIIAFTLSSKTYRDKMKNNTYERSNAKTEAFMPEDQGPDRSTNWDLLSADDLAETDDVNRPEGGTHLKYDFESGSSTIFCRIFFAEKFAQLRAQCACEDTIVESLARCLQFDASGGKSGSAFLKTKDDRFIAKEISRYEMDALTRFAPAYFDYMRNAIQCERPTVLAKIYGFFKIGYRNAVTGRMMRMNVLVMENLFYERRFSKIYDLKGSTRNRLIQPTGRTNEVLLDENLMEIAYMHPLYLRDHSKQILRSALFNDSLFLSNLNVMDYSLVVGVDSERHELVVGIVDYIRTFTWDKKLESWVKDSTFLGGGGKGEPTIVTPKQYKNRFRTAMDKFYFPAVPDRWSKLGAEDVGMDDDETLKSTN